MLGELLVLLLLQSPAALPQLQALLLKPIFLTRQLQDQFQVHVKRDRDIQARQPILAQLLVWQQLYLIYVFQDAE
jgi:hypothetical protein